MMFCKYSLLLLIYYFASVYSNSVISPCKTTDADCINKSVQNAIPKILAGFPELNVESSDPLKVEKINGQLSTLTYNFYDTTVIGYKDCVVSNLRVSPDLVNLHFELDCPSFKMNGKYDITGRLIVLPIEGNGDYSLATGKYKIIVDAVLKIATKNGKKYLSIKNFNLKCKALEPIMFDFKNLFNGNKELSDTVHKFAHENWVEVSNLVQGPTFKATLGKVIKNVNNYMGKVSLDQYKID